MVNQVDTKFTWVIKNYSSLPSKIICSGDFVLDGYKWRLFAFPKGSNDSKHLSLFLEVADYESLSRKRINVRYLLTIVNQNWGNLSIREETQSYFSQTNIRKFPLISLPVSIIQAQDSGYLVNDEVKIVAEIELLGVIDRSGVTEVITQRPTKKIKRDNNCNVTSSEESSIDVSGFQVLPSQVDFVRRVFERHPDIASEFRPMNPLLKTVYMNVLLSLIEILRQSPQGIAKDDLAYAYSLLYSAKDAGFKVDWLEKKLNEVSDKKGNEEAYKTRMQEIEEEVKELKTKMLATTTPLTLDDGF